VNLEQKVGAFIKKFNLVEQGNLVLVGVSGGPDSVALLHILWKLKETLNISLHVAHLNHLLRGNEAEADARLVEQLARNLALPFTIEQFNVASFRQKTGLSIQEAARIGRFNFFERLAKEIKANRVALGHQTDDQAETILLNLIRGAGMSGLKGMLPARGIYIRPLLNVRRREISSYCRQNTLPYRIDTSNLKPAYTRNRIRLQLLPLLEQKYNPQIVPALIRLGQLSQEEDFYLEKQAQQVYKELLLETGKDSLKFTLSKWSSYPAPILRRVLRQAWRGLAQIEKNLSYQHIDKIMEMIENPLEGRILTLPLNIRAIKKGAELTFWREEKKGPAGKVDYLYVLNIPGETLIPEINCFIQAKIKPRPLIPDFKDLTAQEAVFDFSRLNLPLFVRSRYKGDVFMPLGLKKIVKLKDFLIKQKIPRENRDKIPLVTNDKGIIWVGGVRSGELTKVTPQTDKCLYLKLGFQYLV
jgi:tRNA(Ile)-lysidine synthase